VGGRQAGNAAADDSDSFHGLGVHPTVRAETQRRKTANSKIRWHVRIQTVGDLVSIINVVAIVLLLHLTLASSLECFLNQSAARKRQQSDEQVSGRVPRVPRNRRSRSGCRRSRINSRII